MADLSKMSDEELMRLARPQPKISDMTDDELMALAGIQRQTDKDAEIEASMIRMPQRFQKAAGRPEPYTGPTLPTTDEARAMLEPAPNARYGEILPLATDIGPDGQPVGNPRLALPNMIRSPLLGALDIGQGRVQMDEAGNPLSIRPTPNAMATMLAMGTPSPAMGTGKAIAETAAYGGTLDDLYRMNQPAAAPMPAPAPTVAPMAARLIGQEPPAPSPMASQLSAPQSAGAAATAPNLTRMAPREALASRTTGERFTLTEVPDPGDATIYVPGIRPTLAEIQQSPAAAREAKSLRAERGDEFAAKERADQEVYQDFYNSLAGTATMTLRAKEARDAQAARDLAAAWAQKTEADISNVITRADEIIASPDGRRPLVRNTISGVVSELVDARGNPITDPEILYGVRKHIGDMVSREAQREKPLNKRAEATLLILRDELDRSIEAAAPGFRQYLANFSQVTRPIEAQELLQEAMPSLFQGPDRAIAFHRFDKFMRDLVSDRGAPGVNPAKSIDDGTWEELVAMHKSLQRTAAAQKLAQAPGSDTAQNLISLAKRGGVGAAHAIAGVTFPVVGNIAVGMGARALRERSTRQAIARQLAPDVTRYSQDKQMLIDALRAERAANRNGPGGP